MWRWEQDPDLLEWDREITRDRHAFTPWAGGRASDPHPWLDPEQARPASDRRWSMLQVVAVTWAIEGVCLLALLWGQGWRP